ncbi:hypothetical protein AJ78_01533 [Emergomyces pasteurianus Ep9510]|uniref:Uncharacterized protein n=1 Tax=Emergomyces pasteurianus Ep9510 TaxID=1447872 RepID=A0A1J9PQE1_9EURO|nr:hypothetical protein AJ78_01533 [Emergomyces pasteurianus Ep9510]
MAAMANEIILRTSKDWDEWYTDLDAERIDPPMEPEPYEPNMTNLSSEMMHIQLYAHRQCMEKYKTYIKAVKEIYDYISATVDPTLRRALTKTLDPRQILEELKEYIALTKRQREVELTELFLKLFNLKEVRKRAADEWL